MKQAALLANAIMGYATHAPAHRGKMRLVKTGLHLLAGKPARSVYGPLMVVRPRDATNRFALLGTLKADYDDVAAVVASLPSGACFVDIGANLGLFSASAARMVGPDGRVIAFEPAAGVFADLAANLALNGCDNAVPLRLAISGETGALGFREGGTEHSGVGSIAAGGATRIQAIDGRSACALIAGIAQDRPICVKIDVEGHEAHVVTALDPLWASPRVRTVIAEIDQANLAQHGASASVIYDALARHGFVPRLGAGARAHYNEIFDRPVADGPAGISQAAVTSAPAAPNPRSERAAP